MIKFAGSYKYKGYSIYKKSEGWVVISYSKDFEKKKFRTLLDAKKFIDGFLKVDLT